MEKNARSRNSSSGSSNGKKDQNSLGILSMDNLSVFGDLSSFSKSAGSRETSNLRERLNAERLKALETLEKPRSRCDYVPAAMQGDYMTPARDKPDHGNDTSNLTDLIPEETVDLNSSASFDQATPAPATATNIFFVPGEMTGRSTLCKTAKRSSSQSISKHGSQNSMAGSSISMSKHARQSSVAGSSISMPKHSSQISVADILRTSFVEKARVQFSKRLQNTPGSNNDHTNNNSSLTDSFSYSHSLPRTADMSNISLNGGMGISFGSAAGQGFDESFAPAEMMTHKLIMNEISWAQEFAAVPTATLSKEALQKISAQPEYSDIETSVPNSVIAGDPNFSLGNYFRLRSENISLIVGRDNRDKQQLPGESLFETNTLPLLNGVDENTPIVENKTYTKSEHSAKLERNLIKKMQQQRFNSALNKETKKPPTSSEILSLSAIDEALRNLDVNSDTSIGDVVNRLRAHGTEHDDDDDEDKENENLDNTLCKSKSKLTDTISFTDSVLNSSDFRQLQHSVASTTKRQPLSPLADYNHNQPQIVVTHSDNDDADIDEWPSTPVKSPMRRVRKTKSPNTQKSISPTSSDGLQPLPNTDEDVDTDEDKTPVNKKRSLSIAAVRNQTSFCSTRLDGCDAVPTSTECDFAISPNLGKSLSVASVRHVSPLSSPRSCLSSPLLDSTTNSDRRMLNANGNGAVSGSVSGAGLARRANTSPASSEASCTSGYSALRKGANASQLSAAPRSTSRSSSSSEFSHRDGKLLPLKGTHTSLCWGSTKLRTDVRKSMQIKNTSEKRLLVRLSIQGPGYQLVSGDSNGITLQSMECRTIGINFCPTVSGAAIGALAFYAPNCHQPAMEIPLYGYGGNASISIQGLQKGPIGGSFLTVGNVCELASGPLTASFKFYNKGPLTAFAGITIDSTVLMKPRLNIAFEVRPNKIVLPPHSEMVVQVVFRPNREEIKNILKKSSQVITLANMRILCGDEPNRQRMRALVQRMTSEQREQLTSSMLDNLWCTFPGEQPIHSMATMNELPEYILDLVTVVRIIDVALTVNRDFNETAEVSHLCMPDAEETVLFRTVCAANSPTPSNMLDPVDEMHEADSTSLPQLLERNWSVQPKELELDYFSMGNAIAGAKLHIKNSFRSRQYIEINCNVSDLLQISPRECYIAPDGGQVEVTVRPLRNPRRDILLKKSNQVFIQVSMENERINVPVTFKV